MNSETGTGKGDGPPPPTLQSPLLDMNVVIGDRDVKLQCEVSEGQEVTWYHEGQEVVVGSQYRCVWTGTTASLTIRQIRHRDSGQYQCVIGNPGGQVTTTCTLSTREPDKLEAPYFVRELHDMEVEDGDKVELVVEVEEHADPDPAHFFTPPQPLIITVGAPAATFTCRVKGHPLPKVTWTHQGFPLISSHHYTVSHEGDRHSLHILNPVERDAGEYVCHVTNIAGSVTAACSLTFIPDPVTPCDSQGSTVKVPARDGSPHQGQHTDTQDNGKDKDSERHPHQISSPLSNTTTSFTTTSTKPTTTTTTSTSTQQARDVRPGDTSSSPSQHTSFFGAGIRPGSVRKRRDWFEQRSSPSPSPDRAPQGHTHPSPFVDRHRQTGSRDMSSVFGSVDRRRQSESRDVLTPATYQIKATLSSTDKNANIKPQSPQSSPARLQSPQLSPGCEGEERGRTSTLHTSQAHVSSGEVTNDLAVTRRHQHRPGSREVQNTAADSDKLRSPSPGRVNFRSVLSGRPTHSDNRATQGTELHKADFRSVLRKPTDRRDTTRCMLADRDHTDCDQLQDSQHTSDAIQTSYEDVIKEESKPALSDASPDTPDTAPVTLVSAKWEQSARGTHDLCEPVTPVACTMTSASPEKHYVASAQLAVSQPGCVSDLTSGQDDQREGQTEGMSVNVEGFGKQREPSTVDHELQDYCREENDDDVMKGGHWQVPTVHQALQDHDDVMKGHHYTGDAVMKGGHRQAPTVHQALQDQRVPYGGQVVMQCAVSGHPPPHITWTIKNKHIKPSRFFQLSYQEPLAQLLVAEAYSEDEGEYTCTATNSAGTDSSSCYLTVEGRDVSSDVSYNVIEGYGSDERSREESDNQMFRRPMSSVVTKISCDSPDVSQPVSDAPDSDLRDHLAANTSPPASHHVTMEQQGSVDDKETEASCTSVVIKTDRKFEDHYDCLCELGKGKFGSVYECRDKRTGQVFAAKVLKVRGGGRKEEVKREVEVMNTLSHPKLLLLHDAFETARTMVLVTELVGGGELLERVCGEDYVLTEADCVHYLRQLCEGVAYLHARGVVHLDLKPNNVLCVSPHTTHIKIIDFGLARFYRPGDTLHVLFGTPEFVAPEVISYDPVSFATDMWSVGVICYILLSGLSPFLGDSDAETLANVTRSEYDFDDECFDVISDKAKDFIVALLVKRKESRLSAAECGRHAWLSTADRGLGSQRLNTEKLRSFVAARRKLWHKTGQAIMAMQRMASLGKIVSGGSTPSHHDSLTTTRPVSAPSPLTQHEVTVPDVTEPCLLAERDSQ